MEEVSSETGKVDLVGSRWHLGTLPSGEHQLSELSRDELVNHIYVDLGLKLGICCLVSLFYDFQCYTDEVRKEVWWNKKTWVGGGEGRPFRNPTL